MSDFSWRDEDHFERYAAFAAEKIDRLIETIVVGPIVQGLLNEIALEKAAEPPVK